MHGKLHFKSHIDTLAQGVRCASAVSAGISFVIHILVQNIPFRLSGILPMFRITMAEVDLRRQLWFALTSHPCCLSV
jgi:hypothetical protein